MDSWNNLRRKMEKALELFNLVEALSHLDALITTASSPSDVTSLLKDHTLRALPTLHYLAPFRYREEDLPHLERLIRIFTEFGYDINKTLHHGLETNGLTALLASVKKQNVILVECLLRCGATADIRDPQWFSPCHWAIKNGNLKCLQTLLEHGGPGLVTSAPVLFLVLPLLHEAVNNDHLDIVLYLLGKEELGVDINEKAFYDFGSGFDMSCTPLHMALDKGTAPIIKVLMKHPGTKRSRFEELHSLLIKGLTKQALPLLEYFSDDELSADKIGNEWALHRIHRLAFVNKDSVEYTKKVILEYVARGWDPNSVSTSRTHLWNHVRVTMTKYTLFHLACLYKGHEIVKLLVENLGMDIDRKLEGEEQVELTPLLILLKTGQYQGAKYLIEKGADPNVRGNFGSLLSFWSQSQSPLMRRNLTTGDLERNSILNAVEFLVGKGDADGLPLLDQLLSRPDVVWHGANEFHVAVEGKNPVFMARVIKRCADLISKEDLNWVTFGDGSGREPEKVPSLVWLFIKQFAMPEWDDVGSLTDLVRLMPQLGYNLNSLRDPNKSSYFYWNPLIFYVLRWDLEHISSDRLLRTILQFDHLQLNVTNGQGYNPVEFLLHEWVRGCHLSRETSMCWKNRHLQHPPILETIKLLLSHGLNVSEMVICPKLSYHSGFNSILKVLYRAGAKVPEEFFTLGGICRMRSDDVSALIHEKEECMIEWKKDFDRERETGISLKHICGLRVRKMLKCVGDLKMLEGLPKGLKEAVLGIGDE